MQETDGTDYRYSAGILLMLETSLHPLSVSHLLPASLPTLETKCRLTVLHDIQGCVCRRIFC